jgi:hypothetical protein
VIGSGGSIKGGELLQEAVASRTLLRKSLNLSLCITN